MAALLGGVAYSRSWATQPLTLQDGQVFDVLNFDRHTSYTIGPDGSRESEQYFWVRYYANTPAPDDLRVEARKLARALFPVADSLGFATLVLDPTRPALHRRFPLAVFSTRLRFERDTTGQWREVGS